MMRTFFWICLAFIFLMHLSACKKESIPLDAPTPSFTYTVRYEDDSKLFSDNSVFTLIVKNTTTDTAGVTFTWSVPQGIQLTDNSYRFQGGIRQATVTLTASRALSTGGISTQNSQQTVVFQIPAPATPEINYTVFTVYPTNLGDIKEYAITLEPSNCNYWGITSVWSTPDSNTLISGPGSCYKWYYAQPGTYTFILTQTRAGISLSTTKTITVVADNSPSPYPYRGFDITRGTFYQVPMKRPDGTDWNADGTPPNNIQMMTSYHVSFENIDAGNLPSSSIFSRVRSSASAPHTVLRYIDPYPDRYLEVVYQYFQPGEAPVNYRTGIGFVPNDYRFSGTDSGYVELQNGLTHLKLWLKFTD